MEYDERPCDRPERIPFFRFLVKAIVEKREDSSKGIMEELAEEIGLRSQLVYCSHCDYFCAKVEEKLLDHLKKLS